jgi:signal transduction histidine kinase
LEGATAVAEAKTIGPVVKSTQSPAVKRRYTPQRLLYVGTAILIFLLFATNFAVIVHLRETALRNEDGNLKTLSLVLAEQAERTFQSVDLVISSVAETIAAAGVADGDAFEEKLASYDIHTLLREKISGVQQLDAVILVGHDGKVINFSRSWPIPRVDISDRHYFLAMKQDPNLKSEITQPIQNRSTGAWTIYLAHQVRGANGEFIGLILGAMEMRYFEDFYRAISLGEGSSIGLQRLDGIMLARFPQRDAIGKSFSGAKHLLNGGTWGLVHEANLTDGQMAIKAAHLLPNHPALVVAVKTAKAALANWRATAWLLSLGAFGCAIAIVIAALAFGRQWTQHAMLAEAQAEIRRQDDLTATFAEMRTAKEDAEMANRAKSDFLANMSHELRTPLNAVLGFSEILANQSFGPLGNERYREYAQDIHASGTHLLSVINDILDLSKAASGKLELAEDWFDAREIVNSVRRLIQLRIDEGKLSLTIRMPPGPLMLYADERLIRQMLLNLLSNACKFTPPDGHVDCSVLVDAAGMTFAVTDTGIGIPAEDLDRVLEPFVQLDNSLSRGHEGTGLGLALVKVMAELHGGTLRLASEAGRGTTAAVILPLDRIKPTGADEAPASAPSVSAVEPAAV